jgi:hypothetical protein
LWFFFVKYKKQRKDFIMHYRLIITVSADNAEDAREYADDYKDTIHDSYSDWAVIGGRWSGSLCEAYPDGVAWHEYVQEVKKEHNIEYFFSFSPNTKDNERQEIIYYLLRKKWKETLPKPFSDNPMLYDRDEYHGVYSDDVLLVNKALYEEFLKDKPVTLVEDDWLRYEDIDGEKPSEAFIGKKWIVTIDCHW